MNVPGWHRVHRWLSLGAVGFLILWAGSGVVMLFPPPDASPPSGGATPPVPSYEHLDVSPAEAVSAVDADSRTPPARVSTVRLRVIGGDVVYRVVTADESVHLVDAGTGRLVEVNRSMALELARSAYPGGSVTRVERLDRHELSYPYGPLPAYRIVFDDGDGTWAYVSKTSGRVAWSNHLTRIRAGVASLHDFSVIASLIRGGRYLQVGLMLFGTLATVLVVSTGLYLQFRHWKSAR